MQSHVFSKEYPIRVDEAGPDFRLTMLSMFCYIQDLISAHVSSMQIGIQDLNRLGLTWVLSRIRIEADYFPEYGDAIVAETWPGEIKSLFVPRHLILRSVETGRIVARGSSFWLIFDPNAKQPVPPLDFYPIEKDELSRPPFFSSAGKIKSLPGLHPIDFVARSTNIDINKHVNNRFYLSYVQDWLSDEFNRPVKISKIRIHFNSVFSFGEKLTCTGETNKNEFRVTGNSVNGANIFAAEGSFDFYNETEQL